jgi:tetratricopeptide (TPR) repeat protein
LILEGSIYALRKALHDNARGQRIIETIPKKGYRLVAPVYWISATPTVVTVEPDETEKSKLFVANFYRDRRRTIAAAFALFILAVLGTQLLRGPALSAPSSQKARIPWIDRHSPEFEAHQLYVMGRHQWNKRTKDGIERAIAYFQQAIDKDPSYAMAYAGMADAYSSMTEWGSMPPREAIPKARAAAIKALELDNSLSEAHVSLAYVMSNYDWEWTRAESEFHAALRLDPTNATAHQWYAMHLASMRRFTEAIVEIERAQALDPISPIIGLDAGEILYAQGRYPAAVEQYKKTLEFEPGFLAAHAALAKAYERMGRYQEAVEELQKANGHDAFAATLDEAYATSGYQAVLKKRISHELDRRFRGQYSSAAELARYYLALGDTKRTLDWLQKARDDRDSCIAFVTATSEFDALRNNQRFHELLMQKSADLTHDGI